MLFPPRVSYPRPSHLLLLVKTRGLSMNLFEMLQHNRSSEKNSTNLLEFVEILADSGWFCEQCGEGGCCPPGPSLDCQGSPLHGLLARVGLGAGSIVLELAGGSFTFPGFMNRFLSRLLFWTSPVLESFYGRWSWSRKEPRNSCHFSPGCAFGTVLLFSNPAGVFSFFIWLNKGILIIRSAHGVGAVREQGKTML